MKHLFSSGEILNHQNAKRIKEGHLVGETLEYGTVGPDMQFSCHGELDGHPVTVRFFLETESQQHVEFRHMLGILMQSDIFEGIWKDDYVVEQAADRIG